MITDTVVTFGRVLDYDRSGRFRQIRLNTKLDAPVPRPEYDLDGYYRGRRWLTEWLNDPGHQVTFRLEPGDAMFVDNYRVLHGRTEFDASKGMRHLQGAYIDHDGPDTMYRLAVRQLAKAPAA
jgi:gamma-butyrobetaine dioxygenase